METMGDRANVGLKLAIAQAPVKQAATMLVTATAGRRRPTASSHGTLSRTSAVGKRTADIVGST
jgi:hypothetical protein